MAGAKNSLSSNIYGLRFFSSSNICLFSRPVNNRFSRSSLSKVLTCKSKMFAKCDARARAYYLVYLGQVVLTLLCVINNSEGAYNNKIAHGMPVPVIKHAPYIYRGQVFILRETDDPKVPFVAEIVNGGIEMVMQPPKQMPFNNYIRKNDSVPEIQEDPEYFAVLVTTETAALAQLSRSMIIEVPLVMLLTGITKRMPWVLVLKRKNHFEYFRNMEPQVAPIQMMSTQRRHSRSASHMNRTARLITDSQRFDLFYSDQDKAVLQNICANVIEELAYMTTLLHQYSAGIESFDSADPPIVSKPEVANNNTSEERTISLQESFEKYMSPQSGYNKSQVKTGADKST